MRDLNQHIFNKVREHMLRQNARSVKVFSSLDDEVCRYRGDNGLKCAIGVLIDDEFYDEEMEGEPVENRNVLGALMLSLKKDGFTGEELSNFKPELLWRLQVVHDSQEPKFWPLELDKVWNDVKEEGQ